MRQKSRRKAYREYWWRHAEPGSGMWAALDGLSRYIATPRVAKYRLFVWLDARICPDSQLIVIARDDDTTFGILHSRFHEIWSLRRGTMSWQRHRPALHADIHLRDVSVPDRPGAGPCRRPSTRPTRLPQL